MRARACVKRWRASMSVYLFLSFRYYTHKVQGVHSHCGGVGLKSFRTFVIVKRGMGTFLPMKCFGSCVDRFDLHHIRPEISGLGPPSLFAQVRRRGGHIMGGTSVSSPHPPLRKDWKIGTLVIPLVRFLPRYFPERDPQLV